MDANGMLQPATATNTYLRGLVDHYVYHLVVRTRRQNTLDMITILWLEHLSESSQISRSACFLQISLATFVEETFGIKQWKTCRIRISWPLRKVHHDPVSLQGGSSSFGRVQPLMNFSILQYSSASTIASNEQNCCEVLPISEFGPSPLEAWCRLDVKDSWS